MRYRSCGRPLPRRHPYYARAAHRGPAAVVPKHRCYNAEIDPGKQRQAFEKIGDSPRIRKGKEQMGHGDYSATKAATNGRRSLWVCALIGGAVMAAIAFFRYSQDRIFAVLASNRRFVTAMAAGSVTGSLPAGCCWAPSPSSCWWCCC